MEGDGAAHQNDEAQSRDQYAVVQREID